MRSPCGTPPTIAAAIARRAACSSSRYFTSPSCSRPCRSICLSGGCWSDERHGRQRPPPRRQRQAPPAAGQEPVHVLHPAVAGRDLLRARTCAHGRQGMSAGHDKNARLAWTMVALVGGMLGLAYAAVPLYQAFCKATGFAGTPLVAQEGERPVIARTVEVRFDSNTDANLPWRFEPVERTVKVHLGEEKLVFFRATNLSQRPIVGTATYNVTPEWTAGWFNKIQCFCFTEQLLQPGQSVD